VAVVTAARLVVALALCAGVATVAPARADRIKDLATVEGVRKNQLVGAGLVTGLAGTGDDASSPIVRRSMAKLLSRLDIKISAEELRAKNVAIVTVTADLPPFARPGQLIDVVVASSGSAKSLAGGVLVGTPLKGPDQRTWALAQGQLAVGGFLVEAGAGSQRKNHVTVARIPGGAVVEGSAPTQMPQRQLVLNLKTADFTTATRIAVAIEGALGAGTAIPRDAGSVVVPITASWKGKVTALIATIEGVEVTPDAVARVVVDERTGTVVLGGHVRLGPAAIAYGGLSVQIAERPEVSQPAPLGRGQTAVVPRSDVAVTEGGGELRMIAGAANVGELTAALNRLGVKPRDLLAILNALAAAGALRAEVQVL
jgi:flagellar P-ring protein precursor FlgI